MRRGRVLLACGAVALGGAALIASRWAGHRPPSPPPVAADGPDAVAPLSPDAAAVRLEREPEPSVRRKLVRAVARAPDAVRRLRSVYASANDGAAREEALIQASRAGGVEAARWLAEVASTDPRLGARAGAALGRMSSPPAVPELSRIATSDAPVIARANAAQALGRSDGRAQAPELAALAADPAQPLRVRQEAALALAHVGGGAEVAALGRALEAASRDRSQDGEQLRISLVQALGGIGCPEARALLETHAGRTLTRTERLFLDRALARR